MEAFIGIKMKSKVYFYSIVFFLVLQSCNTVKQGIYLEVKNMSINYPSDSIEYNIVNNLSYKVGVVVDSTYFRLFNFYFDNNFQIEIEVFDSDGNKIYYNYIPVNDNKLLEVKTKFILNKIKEDSIYINNYKKNVRNNEVDTLNTEFILSNKDVIENIKYISPKSKLGLKTNLNLKNERRPYSELEYNYDLDPSKEYFMRIKLSVDKATLKLTKEELDFLKENNIQIFHGTIYSNKVPLKFEK